MIFDSILVRQIFMSVVHKNRLTEWMADDPLDSPAHQIRHLHARFHSKCHGGGSCLMEKVGIMFHRILFPLDVGEKRFDSFQSHGIRFAPSDGFFEIPFQCVFLDFQRIESS